MNNSLLVSSVIVVLTFALILPINSYAFHEKLGIDDNKASEFYRTNPNDPAIIQWKNALQTEINDMDECFYIDTAISCMTQMRIIISNCDSHPNTLLACNDSRFSQYPIILEQALNAQKKAIEEDKKNRPIRMQAYGLDILNKCFIDSSNDTSKFEVASIACDLEMGSLQNECQTYNNTLDYCKDQRFVEYLNQNNLTLSQ